MSYIGILNSLNMMNRWKGGKKALEHTMTVGESGGKVREIRLKQILPDLTEVPGGILPEPDYYEDDEYTCWMRGWEQAPFWAQHRALCWEQPHRVVGTNWNLDINHPARESVFLPDKGAVVWRDHPVQESNWPEHQQVWMDKIEKMLAPNHTWKNFEEYRKLKPFIGIDIGLGEVQESRIRQREEALSKDWTLVVEDKEGNHLWIEFSYLYTNYDFREGFHLVHDVDNGTTELAPHYRKMNFPAISIRAELTMKDPTTIEEADEFRKALDKLLTDEVMDKLGKEAMEESLGGIRGTMDAKTLLRGMEGLDAEEQMNYLNSEGPKCGLANLISSLVAQPGWQANVQEGDDGENPGEGPGGDDKRGVKRPCDP